MICDTCSVVVGSKGTRCSNCGLGYHFDCEQFTTYFKTLGTWKCPQCKVANPDLDRGRYKGIKKRCKGLERVIIEEDIEKKFMELFWKLNFWKYK